MIYKKDGYVLKFVITDNGELESEMEEKISEEISHPMLCKNVYSKYGVNVMPYASSLNGIDVTTDIN